MLHAGESLYVDEELRSSNGDFNALMQEDGNFVTYDEDRTPLFATDTARRNANG